MHSVHDGKSLRLQGDRVIDDKLTLLSVERSLQVFSSTCALGAPKNRWTLLQDELIAWQGRKFGYQAPERVVLGIGEELGELAEAAEDTSEARDAVGDISIYAFQFCSAWRLDAGTLITSFPPELVPDDLDKVFGRICHVTLKHLQGIRGFGGVEGQALARTKLGGLMASLFYAVRLTGPYNVDAYYRLVEETAAKVLKREPKLLPPTIGA